MRPRRSLHHHQLDTRVCSPRGRPLLRAWQGTALFKALVRPCSWQPCYCVELLRTSGTHPCDALRSFLAAALLSERISARVSFSMSRFFPGLVRREQRHSSYHDPRGRSTTYSAINPILFPSLSSHHGHGRGRVCGGAPVLRVLRSHLYRINDVIYGSSRSSTHAIRPR